MRTGDRGSVTVEAALALCSLVVVLALVLAAVAIGVLRLLNKAVADEVALWLDQHHVDLDSPWVSRLLDRLSLVDNRQLATVSIGSGVYAILTLIEGTGLCLRKRWGEYFTILVTGSFLPFEIYECFHRFTFIKLLILLINGSVLVYLVFRVRQRGDER